MDSVERRFIQAKKALFDKIYSFLNDKQREAVFSVNGPLLILAGAGSGKTTVLVNRIAHIIRYGDAYASETVPEHVGEAEISELQSAADGTNEDAARLLEKYAVAKCDPDRILCITFTNKAAGEIKERLGQTVGEQASQIWAGTFHSVCVRILRRYAVPAGLAPGFTIYDTDDSKRLIGECVKDLGLDEKLYPVKFCMEVISRAKDRMEDPEALASGAKDDLRTAGAAKVYAEYQKRLGLANAVDFDDIILRAVKLLLDCDVAREYYQKKFRYVSVDEYQDTNRLQFKLTELLSGGYMNLMVVGDDDQSIYRFRGATIENILHFEDVIDDAKTVKLEQNYRSTQNILNAANSIISNNRGRHEKRLWTRNGDGGKIIFDKLEDQNAESRNIAAKIFSLVASGKYRLSDIAVLYRVNAQSNNIEHALAKSGIAYRLIGGLRFYERKEIKDIIAYLCLIQNRNDNIRLKRIINEPKRKIGNTAIEAAEQLAYSEGKSIFEIISRAAEYPQTARFADKFKAFTDIVDSLEKVHRNGSVSELIDMTYILTGYRQMLEDSGFEGKERMENVKELISNAVYYEQNSEGPTLEGFLEEVALVSDIDNYDSAADAVTLMTVHSAKGLEFPVVFLPGMEEGLFPISQALYDPDELEEERRMAYVAFTRAKYQVYCSCVHERLFYGRTQYNKRSRFIDEIPDEYIEQGMGAVRTEASRGDMLGRGEKVRRRELSDGFTHKVDIPGAATQRGAVQIFSEGDKVVHPVFGNGTVISVRPMGNDALYEVAFEEVGTKKLMASYSKLRKT